jgi:prepilin-type N-terminal cleavage/methylation domain-containing protein
MRRYAYAFTLIELLMVLAIISILAGASLPLVGIARRNADVTNTRALLTRVDNAIKLFRNDVGGLPYQAWPDTDDEPPANRLAWHLGTTMDDTQRAAHLAERAAFDARCEPGQPGHTAFATPAQMNDPKGLEEAGTAAYLITQYQTTAPVVLRQCLREWGRVQLAIANRTARIPAYAGVGAPWSDTSGPPLVTDIATCRGWAADYLGRDLLPRFRSGDALLDRWGNPLVWVCPVAPGCRERRHEDLPGRSEVRPSWYGMGGRGRDRATSLASDIRTTAAPAFTHDGELWSAGPDGVFAAQRTSEFSRDDIATQPYRKGLP